MAIVRCFKVAFLNPCFGFFLYKLPPLSSKAAGVRL